MLITANVCIVAIPTPLMTYGTAVESSNGNSGGMSTAYPWNSWPDLRAADKLVNAAAPACSTDLIGNLDCSPAPTAQLGTLHSLPESAQRRGGGCFRSGQSGRSAMRGS